MPLCTNCGHPLKEEKTTQSSSGMGNIDNKYIDNAIDELVNLLGVKEEIPKEIIHRPFRTGNIKRCIENIANYLGLPIIVKLSYVPSKYVAQNSGNKFESAALAKTDSTGRGVQSITAQVSIPSCLPLYGSSELQNFPIAVKISDNCPEHPETFMGIMAHELSHILLHSLWHKEKDNEFYVDLTAMALGFSTVMKIGRKVVETKVGTKENIFSTETLTTTLTTTYGYLSDEQFNFAFSKIGKLLEQNAYPKKILLQKVAIYREQLTSYKKEFSKFKKLVEYVDRNRDKRIKREDAARIVQFHQLNYADELTEVVRGNERKLKEINGFCMGFVHYTHQKLSSLRRLDDEMDTSISNLGRHLDLLSHDVSMLTKYAGFIYKIKLAWLSTKYPR